jgi:hypothetical protein
MIRRENRHYSSFSCVSETAETVSVVSMTPLKTFPRCHWHLGNFRPDPHSCFRGVIDTAETVSAVSMTPLKPPWLWNLKYHRDFNHRKFFCRISAVSLTPLKQLWGSGLKFQRCQWHRWNRKTTLRVPKENIQQNYFMGKYPHTR